MENLQKSVELSTPKLNSLFVITPLSKILSALVFIIVPFIGFFIGMNYASEPIVVTSAPQPIIPENQATQTINATETEAENHTGTSADSSTEGVATSTVTAYVVALDPSSIELDYVDILSGEEAVQKKIDDGICLEKDRDTCFPLYDRNVNPQLRTFTHVEDLPIFTDRNMRITREEFTPYLAFTTFVNEKEIRHGALFEVIIDDKNVVTKLQGIFRP